MGGKIRSSNQLHEIVVNTCVFRRKLSLVLLKLFLQETPLLVAANHDVALVLTILGIIEKHRHRRTLVLALLSLFDIPIATGKREVDNPHIAPDSLHLLAVPQGESIVVAKSKQNCIGRTRLQIVGCKIAAGVTSRAVVVVPILRRHLDGHKHSQASNRASHHRCKNFLLAAEVFEDIPQRKHAQSAPNTERIERTRVCIVSLTGLVRSLIEVNHNCNASHQEKHKDHETIAPVIIATYKNAQQSQQQRQQIIHIASVILGVTVRQVNAACALDAVYPVDARNPVAIDITTRAILHVGLSSGKIPHEIAEVHVSELISEEEPQILPERWTVVNIVQTTPLLVNLDMIFGSGIHPREEALILLVVLVLGRRLLDFQVLAIVGDISVFVFAAHHVSREVRAVEKRVVAILFAVQVTQEAETVARLVFVDGRIAE